MHLRRGADGPSIENVVASGKARQEAPGCRLPWAQALLSDQAEPC